MTKVHACACPILNVSVWDEFHRLKAVDESGTVAVMGRFLNLFNSLSERGTHQRDGTVISAMYKRIPLSDVLLQSGA